MRIAVEPMRPLDLDLNPDPHTCRFYSRYNLAGGVSIERPVLQEMGPGRQVAGHFVIKESA